MWRILKTKCILQGIHNNKDLLTNLKEVNFSQGKDMSRDHHIRPRSHMLLHQIKLLQTNKVGDLKESSNRSWMARRETKEMYEKMDTLFSNLNTKYDAVATHVKKLETQVTKLWKLLRDRKLNPRSPFATQPP
ncbi:unnamed protein product [Microthlaspi erraticum]|uniref:Uncharacterized protein n=1 Tax=Microthlaspi erraticum TaxID=1685480 RepID=A0A6D2KLR5_9BRAS|nr:unnamed protein product [Microthlaspi erraticum]